MSGQTSTEAIIAEIKGLIQSGEYPPGSRFLSERELVTRFGVSRPTIRQALGSLAQMGVLEARQGAGTVVARTGENVLRAPFELLMLLEQPTLHELYEVRELVEVHLAGRAAERRTGDDLIAIEAALEAMRSAVTDPDRMTDPNLHFHMAVAAAAHLPLLERFMSCLHDSIRTCIEATRPGVQDWIVSYEIHERIYDAIRQRRSTDARRAMTLHMAMALDELRRLGVTEEGTTPVSTRTLGTED